MPTLAPPPPPRVAAPRATPRGPAPPSAGASMVRVTPDVERVLLRGVSWETYLRLLEEVGPTVGRMTYDNGLLEIEMPGKPHERIKSLLRRFFEAYSREMDIDVVGAGSTTWKKKLAQRGLEPDECYFVERANDFKVLDSDDDTIPPDIAIEVDLSNPSIPKEPIYADLGVAEVWRWSDGRLRFRRLIGSAGEGEGGYADADRSRFLPGLDPAWAERVVPLADRLSDLKLERTFLDLARAAGEPSAVEET